MIFSIPISIALVAVAIGSYTDLRTLEVPDWLNYTLIALGLGGAFLYSIAFWDISFLLRSIMGLALAMAIGFAMYYTGQWGGGDSKMLFGLGAVLGFSLTSNLWSILDEFFIKFLINMLFAGAIYGLAWIFFMFFKNTREVIREIKKELSILSKSRIRLFTGAGVLLCILLIYFSSIFDLQTKMILVFLLFALYFMSYLIIFVKAVESISMVRWVEPEKLTEGDWIVDEIKIDGQYITGPKDLGIEKSKIHKLIRLRQKGRIKKVRVKYGIPFVPSFLIALIYTILTDNIILLMFI